MPRKVRVATTSFAFGSGRRTVEQNRADACALVEAAAAAGAELVCLAENFLHTGLPAEALPVVEPLPGPTFDALAAQARRHGVWIVAGFCVRTEAGLVENSAVVLDRAGRLAGRYAKVHPTIEECVQRGITPGTEATVLATDFGRLGLAICYDIGWPEHWAALRARGAELVVWPSAYDGGFPLQVYAWTNQYYVVSAVRTAHARVIDLTGQVLATTSRWHRLTACTIDLEKEVFHIDGQVEALWRLQRELGSRVTVQAFSEENIFTLESNDPAWPLARLKAHYGLENFHDYHRRAAAVQEAARAAAAGAPPAAAGPAGRPRP
jgi:beta-ureidopropionase